MVKNKFYIKSVTQDTNKAGDVFNILKYNRYKKGVSAKKMKKYLKKTIESIPDGYEYAISTLNTVDWRASGYGWRKKSDDIVIYNPSKLYNVVLDQDIKHYSASIIVRQMKPEEGGKDMHNDCLYYCLKFQLGDLKQFTWTYPNSMKKFLNVERDDCVNVCLIPKLEEKLKTRIEVSGDVLFNSGSSFSRCVKLKLENGHYSINKDQDGNDMKKMIRGIRKQSDNKPNKLITFTKRTTKIILYDGKEFKEMNNDIFRKQYYSSDNTAFYHNVDSLIVDSIEEVHNQLKTAYNKTNEDIKDFVEEQKKQKSKNIVNPLLFRDFKQVVAYYSFYWGLDKFEVEALTPLEAKFIHNSFMGGLIHADKGEYENVKCYDINSMYPSIFSSSGLLIPLKCGDFKQIDSIPDIVPFGIYRCMITGDIDTKIFRVNNMGYYSHYDINAARKLGYDVEIIQDGTANALLYPANSRTPAKSIFKRYISYFYELKKALPKNKICKLLLNLLWGALCQKEEITTRLTESTNSNFIKNIMFNDKDECIATFYRQATLYKYPTARLGPFLTSYARKQMGEIMAPYSDDILRVHTDGFIIQGDHNIETSQNIGKLKIEYEAKKVDIVHVNLIKKIE